MDLISIFVFQTNFWLNRWESLCVMNLKCISSLKNVRKGETGGFLIPRLHAKRWPQTQRSLQKIYTAKARSIVLSGGTWSMMGLCLRGRTSVWANVWWSRDSGAGAHLNLHSPSGFILLFCFCALAAHSALSIAILFFTFSMIWALLLVPKYSFPQCKGFHLNSGVSVTIVNNSSNTWWFVYCVVLVNHSCTISLFWFL